MDWNWLIGVLILICDIYAILRIAGSGASPGMKALWIVLVLLLPFLGLIIWWFVGPK